jgi:hypothetical protein
MSFTRQSKRRPATSLIRKELVLYGWNVKAVAAENEGCGKEFERIGGAAGGGK